MHDHKTIWTLLVVLSLSTLTAGCDESAPLMAGKPCDPSLAGTCGGNDWFCDSRGNTCAQCPVGGWNCDGVDICESLTACAAPATPPTTESCRSLDPGACGGDGGRFCNTGNCAVCPLGSFNCDGVGDCECSGGCAGQQCAGDVAGGGFFDDVPSDDPYRAAVQWAVGEGLLLPCSSTPPRFCPDDAISRADLARTLTRLKFGQAFTHGESPYFADVPATHDAFGAVQKMYEEQVAVGLPDGLFHPEDDTRRSEAATMLVKLLFGSAFSYSSVPHFTDVGESHWAYRFVQKLYEEQISIGCGNGRFCPDDPLPRSHFAVLLFKAKN